MQKTILITGGAGFIGSHLCDRLIKQGNQVICVDNFFTGVKSNIIHLIGNPNFKLIRHDITCPLVVEADEIYNLACSASPTYYQFDPIQTIKTSIQGAINILELASTLKIKILQASTSEVYGDPTEHPQRESYWGNVNPIGLRACYSESKRCAEALFFSYYRQRNVKIKLVRIFNTYGPRMRPDDGRVVSNFVVQALKGKEITIYGNGTQTRSFCYISDLIEGLIKMMKSPDDCLGPINIGNPEEISILNLAKKIIEITNSKSKIVFKPLPEDDPIRRKPDITLAKEKLNWEPKISLEEGLKKTIDYFEKILKADEKI